MDPLQTLLNPNQVIAASPSAARPADAQGSQQLPARVHDYADHTEQGPARSLWPQKHSPSPVSRPPAAVSPPPLSQRHVAELRARGLGSSDSVSEAALPPSIAPS